MSILLKKPKDLLCIALLLMSRVLSAQIPDNKVHYISEKIRRGTSFDTIYHFVSFYQSGQKRLEYFQKNGLHCDTLKQWSVEGKIYQMNIYSDSGYTEMEHILAFPEHIEPGDTGMILFNKCIRVKQTGAYTKAAGPPAFRVIDDSSTWTRHSVDEDSYKRAPFYIRAGTWKVFYSSGVLHSYGRYLPERYYCLCPDESKVVKKGFGMEDWYFRDGKPYEGFCAGGIGYLKDGEWVYFDECGEEKYREYYRDGLLRQKIE